MSQHETSPGLFPSAAQWTGLRAAWRERATNPLVHYSALARMRRARAMPLRQRVALAVGSIVLACGVACSVFLAEMEAGNARWPELSALAAGAGAACALFFAVALFNSLVTTGQALALATRRRTDLQLDAPLAASRLAPAEVLVGLLWPPLRALLPILGAMSAVPIALTLWRLDSTGQSRATLPPPGPAQSEWHYLLLAFDNRFSLIEQAALLAPLSWSGIAVCAALSTLILLLLLLIAGCGRRMDVHAPVIAALTLLGTLPFLLFGQMAGAAIFDSYSRHRYSAGSIELLYRELEPLPLLAALLALAGLLTLGVRARNQLLALAVPYSLPLLFIASGAGLNWFIATQFMHTNFDPSLLGLDFLTAWGMLLPCNGLAAPHVACYGTGVSHLLSEPRLGDWRGLPLLAIQLGLIAALLRGALDAIEARREAGTE